MRKHPHHRVNPLQHLTGQEPPIVFPLPVMKQEYHSRDERCRGCPYPHHGLFCHDGAGGSCLREDMQKIEERQRQSSKNR